MMPFLANNMHKPKQSYNSQGFWSFSVCFSTLDTCGSDCDSRPNARDRAPNSRELTEYIQ